MATAVGHDDYALVRVPASARFHWFSVATQRFGQLSSLASFLLGATLGFGMDFWSAVLAITLGSVILEIVTIFTGIAGQREGLSTSVLARWTGFGGAGSSLIGIAISLSAIGWFGIQNAVSAQGLANLVGVLPAWAWALIFGVLVTLIVMFGMASMAWTAYVAVPAFLLLAGWSIIAELSKHSLGDLLTAPPGGPALTLIQGTTIVAGGFIVGAVITPDMSRFNRSAKDVVKQTVLGITLGEYVIGLIGVLLALALKTNDVVAIVTSTSGFIGTLIVITATLKINDWNLYAASLGIVNFADRTMKRKLHRGAVTLTVGLIGTVLGAAGILGHFTDFLILLGVVFPPIAGIMVAEYFVVQKWRPELESSRKLGRLPEHAPAWVPATIVIWVLASVIGYFVAWGLPSINSLFIAFILYAIAGRMGLIRGIGSTKTYPDHEPVSVPAPAAS
ncbi:purine-cytosine permease family protein [Arthrobacter sp. MMS18-M83]|uniref:purine-cytosine permease family protein n=1 Tax=Arthrobacter sp. MMS18-M83 TaxID=2996261 RepID=UPI00227CD914|nr:cytosine permease [Arthrobacter sp. MMS18-M83]WAH95643.1 cytosine permease [Arthrobacter sp. MMS18-M83]